MCKNYKIIRRYGEPFKLNILDKITSGKPNKNQLVKPYGITPTTLNEWIRKYSCKNLMSTRVKGVRTSETLENGILIALLDQPLIAAEHFLQIVDAFEIGKNQIIVSKTSTRLRSTPLLFDTFY